MEFPLYDALRAEATEDAPASVWAYAMNLPLEHAETLLALVLHHAAREGALPAAQKSRRVVCPYKGKVFDGNKGVVFKLEDLPPDLRRVLGLYLQKVVA